MWCVAGIDAEYVEKMEDVLAVYERPYDASGPLVSLDEKPATLHVDVHSLQPADPARMAKRVIIYSELDSKSGPAEANGSIEGLA